jgi:hypothetical protein
VEDEIFWVCMASERGLREKIKYRFRVPSASVFTLYSYSKALEYRFRATAVVLSFHVHATVLSVCPISLLFRSIEFGPLLNKIFFCTPSVHLSPLSKKNLFIQKSSSY